MYQTIVSTMNKVAKQAPTDRSSPFSHLPDEITLYILTKLTDLKTLCFCLLVSKRFSRFVHQLDSISFTAQPDFDLHKLDLGGNSVQWKSFLSAIRSMKNFRFLKSLSIELSPSIYNEAVEGYFTCKRKIKISNKAVEDHFMFKWKIKFSHDNIASYVFLSPNSVSDTKGSKMQSLDDAEDCGQEEDVEERKKKVHTARVCLLDAFARFKLLVNLAIDFPVLEEVYIRDSSKRGMVSASGGMLTQMRKRFGSITPRETIFGKLPVTRYLPRFARRCYVPKLELPVSGYVMKEVTLVYFEWSVDPVENYCLLDYGEGVGVDDKDEAAYIEAVMEIFKKHWGKIERDFGFY